MSYSPTPREGGGTRSFIEWRAGPLLLARWEETPFEWQFPHFYEVTRDYVWTSWRRWIGPMTRMRGGMALTPTEDGGTRVLVWAELTPRNALGWLLCRWLIGPLGVKSGTRQCAIFERYLHGELADPFPQLLPRTGPARLVPAPLRGAGPATTADTSSGRGAAPDAKPAAPHSGAVTSEPEGTNSSVLSVARDKASSDEDLQESGPWRVLAETGSPPALVTRLRRHLIEASDGAVARMRAYELADAWGVDRRETLVLCLRATLAGVLQMTWEVLCPNCRAGKARHTGLEDLRAEAHCDSCDVVFDASFDRNIEVRFSPSPSIRAVPDSCFCVGGPRNTPHIVARATLEPGAVAPLVIDLVPGAYDVRSLQSRGTLTMEARTGSEESARSAQHAISNGSASRASDDDLPVALHDGATQVEVTLDGIVAPMGGVMDGVGGAPAPPTRLALPAGMTALHVRNAAGVPITLEIASRAWPETATTAAAVSALQEFRDLFSSHVLAPGLQLSIQRMAFLFTDLAGSTALYERIGQAQAFGLVQAHFAILRSAVIECRGALVKTIGDAVMAVFPSASDAVAAALEIQRRIRELDISGGPASIVGSTLEIDVTRFIKVGVHVGPCVAVTANERLDYFGTTVNVAARVQSICRPGEITLTAAAANDHGAALLLDERSLEVDRVTLKGLREPVEVFRVLDPVISPLPVLEQAGQRRVEDHQAWRASQSVA